jgi:hypothetical protein
MTAEFAFPCKICGAPARPDRVYGMCHACFRNCCGSCVRKCGKCGRTFCENDVEERTIMIQQVAHSKLLCEKCRKVLLV